MALNSIGLYVHIPWCIQKCPYCDFNSHTLKGTTPEQQYIDTLLNDLQKEIKQLTLPRVISSIFIGGGTPSLFSAKALNKLLNGIMDLIPLQDNVEITLEANPGTVESQKFSDYRKIGINRLSIGIQSFNNKQLTNLGRIHTAQEALIAVDIAQQAGFENINLDLMFGLPEQTVEEMLFDIQTAINLNPSHISFYQLTIEPNTFFYQYPPKLPKDDLIFLGQKQCQKLLANNGYTQYEISAYAKNKTHCQHNLNYWTFGDYLGIGAGAHGKISDLSSKTIIRTVKPKNPEQYLKNKVCSSTNIALDDLPLEFLMNQLRLKKGFNLKHYETTTGLNKMTLEPALSQCINEGLVTKQNDHYYCSEKGWDFLDDILEKFIHQ